MKYYCENCNYECSKQSEFNKHKQTNKHKRVTMDYKKSPKSFGCMCGKTFVYRQGLYKHKKSCHILNSDTPENIDIDNKSSDINVLTNTMMQLIKQNQEFKEIIIELSKKDTTINNNNNNTTNNNHQKFNLNFFLNNTCKDAMNMSDFIDNMDINFEDIENIGKNGYVTGMTDMIMSRIKSLDVTKRPMHCTDLKRETMYIKDNNEWEKDTPDNKKLHKMMSIISKRNYSTIPLWRDEHPECQNMKHPQCDFSVDMLRNVLGDVGEGQIKLDNKVIKNISKHIIVDK
jgi:hypothetical protein